MTKTANKFFRDTLKQLTNKRKLLLFIILLIAFLMRVLFLDRVPTGVSNDEMDYLLNAKSLWLSGSDISQTWNPLSLTAPKSSFPQGEIAPLVTFWLVGILPLSLLTSKLVYALIATGTVWLLIVISQKLIGEYEAYIIGAVGAINPWLIFFGRTAYDTPLAIFFYLLGFYMLLSAKKWKILFAIIPFLLGFYAYIGTKLIFLPFIFITTFYAWKSNMKDTKQYGILVGVCAFFFVIYTVSALHGSATRIHEIANPQMDSIRAVVNSERRLSIQSPLTALFSNKYIVFAKYAIEKYANAFSPNFLFLSGDGKSLFTLWYHGSFYILDAIFMLIGWAVLFAKYRRVLYLLIALTIIAPIPSVMSTVGSSYAIRSMLLAPILIVMLGVGVAYAIKNKPVVQVSLLGIYLLLVLNFLHIYFLRNPLYNSESFNFSSRVLAKYLSLQDRPVYVINGDATTPYKQYLFYNNALTKGSASTVANAYKKKEFVIKTIHFITCNQTNEIKAGSIIVFDQCKKIPVSKNEKTIAQLSDAGKIYTIQNDKLCLNYALSSYPQHITFADLQIETLSIKNFCEKYITR